MADTTLKPLALHGLYRYGQIQAILTTLANEVDLELVEQGGEQFAISIDLNKVSGLTASLQEPMRGLLPQATCTSHLFYPWFKARSFTDPLSEAEAFLFGLIKILSHLSVDATYLSVDLASDVINLAYTTDLDTDVVVFFSHRAGIELQHGSLIFELGRISYLWSRLCELDEAQRGVVSPESSLLAEAIAGLVDPLGLDHHPVYGQIGYLAGQIVRQVEARVSPSSQGFDLSAERVLKDLGHPIGPCFSALLQYQLSEGRGSLGNNDGRGQTP